jgi:hypothetical protein
MATETKTYTASQTHVTDDVTRVGANGVFEFGGEDDLWGATDLTPAALNDPSFKISYDIEGFPISILTVDDVEVEVFFRTPVSYNFGERPFAPSPFASCTIGRSPTGVPRIVLVGMQGLIRISDDLGTTWVDKDSGTAVQLWGCTYNSITAAYTVVGDGGVTLRSTNFGETWVQEDAIVNASLYSVAAASAVDISVGDGRSTRRRTNAWAL